MSDEKVRNEKVRRLIARIRANTGVEFKDEDELRWFIALLGAEGWSDSGFTLKEYAYMVLDGVAPMGDTLKEWDDLVYSMYDPESSTYEAWESLWETLGAAMARFGFKRSA